MLDWRTVRKTDKCKLSEETLKTMIKATGVEQEGRKAIDYHKIMASKLSKEEVIAA